MEQFSLLRGDQTLKESREQLNNALMTVRSLAAGESFPKENLAEGMLCYRTDEKRLYQLTDAALGTWTAQIPADITGSAGSVAWENVSEKPTAFPSEVHTHSYAGASAAGGAATSAVKLNTARKINGIAFDGTADITLPTNIATQAEAKEGTDNAKYMTPLRVSEAVGALMSGAVTGLSVSGRTITYTKKDGTTGTITTQDTSNGITAVKAAQNGYAKFANGLIVQWGRANGADSATQNTFPLAFPSACYAIACTSGDGTGKTSSGFGMVSSITKTGFKVTGYCVTNPGIGYIAVGK